MMAVAYSDILFFQATGDGKLDETLTTLTPDIMMYRLISVKLHTTRDVKSSRDEKFVIQIIDLVEDKHNAVILSRTMLETRDIIQHWEGFGMNLANNQTIKFTWSNSENIGWGLTASYVEDIG